MNYLKGHGKLATPQREPIPDRADQTRGDAGGYVWEASPEQRLRRFLILGTEGGSYYAKERRLTRENLLNVSRFAEAEPELFCEILAEVSERGLAPRQQPTLYALAIGCSSPNLQTRKLSLALVPRLCRTPTMLSQFLGYTKENRGFGRGLRRAVASIYEQTPVRKLAYQAVKYPSREGYSQRDFLRLSHPKADTPERAALFDLICGRDFPPEGYDDLKLIEAREMLHREGVSAVEAAGIIRSFSLPREAVPTELLQKKEVWEALLPNLLIGALVRNLATLSRHGIIDQGEKHEQYVIRQLTNPESLKLGRVHPFTILLAAAVYKIGEGWRSRQTWTVNERIVDALGDAFYLSFQNVEPTNKKIMLCLDVSSSMMGSYISGSLLSAAEATAALALVTARTEPNYITCAFAHEFRPVSLTPRMTLAEAMQTLYGHGFGGTDCALPITTALEKGIVVDLFVVYTDSETWVGRIHPSQALAEYRRRINPEAKLAVVAMTSGGFTIADPLDAGMLDVVGFDASVPELLRNFTLGLV